ncbi:MAG TPA: endonuclease/exonuclease/phosphatase family protein [Miltoncostaeaceae bacterium]|nr:endonuclease/exonuclease/phosphatase family protein [Miltoncostaeaceae bacterium]
METPSASPAPPEPLRLVSWNVAGRVRVLPDQIAAVLSLAPGLVLLQEVTSSTLPRWTAALQGANLAVRAGAPAGPGARRLGTLIAARDLAPPGADPGLEWPERAVGGVVRAPWGPVEAWSAYVPQAANGWVKVRTLEALARLLLRPGGPPRLLAGDLNTPRAESERGEITTFAQTRRGAAPVPERGPRWDAAERDILVGLGPEVVDAFRDHHGYGVRARSWRYPSGWGGYRLDHLLVSRDLRAGAITYVEEWRAAGLSDHAALVADVVPREAGAP